MKIIITADGDYPIDGVFSLVNKKITILTPAVMTGTVVMGYVDAASTFVPLSGDLTAGAVAAGKQLHIQKGECDDLILRVTSYSADFTINVVGQG